jgi:hypothetical protein
MTNSEASSSSLSSNNMLSMLNSSSTTLEDCIASSGSEEKSTSPIAPAPCRSLLDRRGDPIFDFSSKQDVGPISATRGETTLLGGYKAERGPESPAGIISSPFEYSIAATLPPVVGSAKHAASKSLMMSNIKSSELLDTRSRTPPSSQLTPPITPVNLPPIRSQVKSLNTLSFPTSATPDIQDQYYQALQQQLQQKHSPVSNVQVLARDQNPPCNTLYVGNLPSSTNPDELEGLFDGCRGYKRLCFRMRSNGPMCFVEVWLMYSIMHSLRMCCVLASPCRSCMDVD